MSDLKKYVFWFITGSQHLYGTEAVRQVENAKTIANSLNSNVAIPCKVVFKAVVTTPDEIRKVIEEANADPECSGIITWMHTFSPAKMWITGLSMLQKPLLHLHTQFNRDIPWDSIDMDFMNLNQAAHGDREYGFIGARMRISRKVIAGHWEDPEVSLRIAGWMRAAVGCVEGKISRSPVSAII